MNREPGIEELDTEKASLYIENYGEVLFSPKDATLVFFVDQPHMNHVCIEIRSMDEPETIIYIWQEGFIGLFGIEKWLVFAEMLCAEGATEAIEDDSSELDNVAFKNKTGYATIVQDLPLEYQTLLGEAEEEMSSK